jgi:hypothetical protein
MLLLLLAYLFFVSFPLFYLHPCLCRHPFCGCFYIHYFCCFRICCGWLTCCGWHTGCCWHLNCCRCPDVACLPPIADIFAVAGVSTVAGIFLLLSLALLLLLAYLLLQATLLWLAFLLFLTGKVACDLLFWSAGVFADVASHDAPVASASATGDVIAAVGIFGSQLLLLPVSLLLLAFQLFLTSLLLVYPVLESCCCLHPLMFQFPHVLLCFVLCLLLSLLLMFLKNCCSKHLFCC